MDTYVESFLKTGESFTRIDQFDGPLEDKFYIEGAIVCRIRGQQLLTLKHWDLVDQLWAYLIEPLITVSDGRVYDSCFPDQPLRLRLAPGTNDCVTVTIGDKSRTVRHDEIVATLSKGGEHFFREMKRLAPDDSANWDHQLERLQSLN